MFGFGSSKSKREEPAPPPAKPLPPLETFLDKAVLEAGLEAGPELIGAIDQGTSSTRFVIFTPKGELAASAQVEHTQIFSSEHDKVGWHEHDPLEIWHNVGRCIDVVAKMLTRDAGVHFDERPIASIGITNQRETVVAWDAQTGLPFYNAIVWDDTRTGGMIESWKRSSKTISQEKIRSQTGLPLASYFAGTKVKWMLDNVPALQASLKDKKQREHVRFGTIDTWLIYQLTGSVGEDVTSESQYQSNVGGLFLTDVTNASRWLFMDLDTLDWDYENLVDVICAPHKLPKSALPAVCPSSQVYGTCDLACGIEALDGVPIGAILGDQQAALFGQCAFESGEAKNTYGTGLFLMMNTGMERMASTHGLLTTVAYQLGRPQSQSQNEDDQDEGSEVMVHADDSDEDEDRYKVRYALEGSVSHSGSTIQWLRDQLRIIENAAESETLAQTTTKNDGVYMVPAFSGLFAPRWRSDARACLVGLAASHHRGHVCRAALEATAYQTRDVFEAIHADSGVELSSLKVDGGGTHNKLMMQFQADILDISVVQPRVLETTSMGAAFAAGLAVGVWKDMNEIQKLWSAAVTYEPAMSSRDRDENWAGWEKAVTKSLGWIDVRADGDSYVNVSASEALVDSESEDGVMVEGSKPKEERDDPPVESNAAAMAVVLLVGISVGFLLGGRSRKS